MSDVKLCRICVRKGVKMYEHDRYQLMIYYKEVTGSEISIEDSLPKWFCYECAALLYKFYLFKRKCNDGLKVLQKLSATGCTYLDKLTKIPKITTLGSHLQILYASTDKSVKTFTVHHSEIQNVSNNKYNGFTEVFVDDVKSDTETSKLSICKVLAKMSTDIENTPEISEHQFDDFNNDADSIDVPILTDKEPKSPVNTGMELQQGNKNSDDKSYVKKSQLEGVTKMIETTNHQMDSKESVIDEDKAITVLKTNYDKDNDTDDINPINYDSDSDSDIRTDLQDKEKNKFQRSVKKKFLDEKNWTKITLSDEEASRRFQEKALEEKYLKATFKCVDCYRTFSQEDMMRRHIKLRHCESLGPYVCRHCRMRFKWKSRLQKHLKEHYTIYKCLRCELSFPVEISAFQHDYSHNGVTWTCEHCGQRFRHSSTYYTHLRKHKSKFVCTLCGVSFVSEFGLFMHKRVKHVISEDPKVETSNTYCKVCDIKFDNSKGYDEHFAESALHASELSDGATSLPLKTKCTKKRVPRISTNCTTCGKTFSTYAAFSKHHLSAHPELVLPKSRTDKQGGLKICEVCGATLASAWSLMNHLNTHSRVRRFTCKTCGTQLSSRSVLQRHQLTHMNDKSFVCNVCHKRFAHRSGLQLHMRTHDNDPTAIRDRKKKSEETPNVVEYFKNYGSLATNYK